MIVDSTVNLSSSPVSRRIEVEVELEPRVELEEVFLHTQVSLGGLCHLSHVTCLLFREEREWS